MLVVLLFSVLATIAVFAAMPFLLVFFEVVGVWYENLFDRLELAADMFRRERGWF